MDPLKLLSRSTSKKARSTSAPHTPSSGQNATPELFPETPSTPLTESRKRKRKLGSDSSTVAAGTVDWFGRQEVISNALRKATCVAAPEADGTIDGRQIGGTGSGLEPDGRELRFEDRRRVLKEHKLKITWLNPTLQHKKARKNARTLGSESQRTGDSLVPRPLLSFDQLAPRFGVGAQLASNLLGQGYNIATEVQIAALPLLLDNERQYLSDPTDNLPRDHHSGGEVDLLSVAPTGSGKTLAFLIPLIHRIRQRRSKDTSAARNLSAVILAPTNELASQIANEGRKLAKDTGVMVTQMRKGMQLGQRQDGHTVGDNGGEGTDDDTLRSRGTIVKADVIVSTPGMLQSALRVPESSDTSSAVRYLVLDEADVLLDPLSKQQTLDIWNALTHPSLRVSMWSATMGSNVEELAQSTIAARRRKLQRMQGQEIAEVPQIRLVVGLKDSAAPNVEHKLIYAASEQGKLMGLRQLLHPTSSSYDTGPILRPPFLVFVQTIERAIALHAELRYDVPAEAGGINRVAVLHAELSATARTDVMTRFRKGSIWILITTDLLSRGVDFRGVNGVVNYDIPGSSAAYIHRIGRTGRAGRQGGIAVTLYSKEDTPYLKHIANVMAMAQRQRGEEASDMQQWLLDALPKLSKNEKQALTKHGVKSRAAKGRADGIKTNNRSKISTKAGFVRRAESRRKGAKASSQQSSQRGKTGPDVGDESVFAGFD